MKSTRQRWLLFVLLSLLCAAGGIAQTVYHNFWYDIFGYRWTGFVELGLVPAIWVTFTIVAFRLFPAPRKRLWWLVIPGLWCFLPLMELFLAFFAWSIRGFAR